MKKRHPQIDLNKVKTYSIAERHSKVSVDFLGKVYEPGDDFDRYIESLPKILKAADLKRFARLWADCANSGKEVILMMGAHPIKTGLSPIIIDLIKRGLITALAGNGAVAIHDCEMSMFGQTSEEVIEGLADGTFGMARETGEFLNEAANYAYDNGIGFGEALGDKLDEAVVNREISLLWNCREMGIPCTIHVGIGTDIVHQQPSCRGEAVGAASYNDFKIFAQRITQLSGGIVINLGSAVVMPEVFLKALTAARNVSGAIKDFHAANFDMIQHYRANTNVVHRPTATGGGKPYSFTGHHEIMFPLLAAMVKSGG